MLKYLNLVAAVVVVGATTMTMAGGMDYAIVTTPHAPIETPHITMKGDWCNSKQAMKIQSQLEYAKALEWFYSDEEWEGDIRTIDRYSWKKTWPCGGC